MHIAILGAGALGSILAAHLARAGQDVTLLARGPRAALLAERGVHISGLADITAPVRVLTDHAQLKAADLFILTVKTYDTQSALAGVDGARVSGAFSVQNGIEKDEQLAAVFGRGAVIGAAADFSGEVQADGSVRFTRNEGLHLGELPSGVSQRVRDIVAMISGAGIDTRAEEQMLTIEWSKLVSWLAMTPLALLTRLETRRLLMDPDLARLMVRLLNECLRLTDALGVEVQDLGKLAPARTLTRLSLEDAIAWQRRNGEAMQAAGNTTHKFSALQDLERGRRLEIEETFGYVLRRAGEKRIEMPALETCYRMVKALDRAGSS